MKSLLFCITLLAGSLFFSGKAFSGQGRLVECYLPAGTLGLHSEVKISERKVYVTSQYHYKDSLYTIVTALGYIDKGASFRVVYSLREGIDSLVCP